MSKKVRKIIYRSIQTDNEDLFEKFCCLIKTIPNVTIVESKCVYVRLNPCEKIQCNVIVRFEGSDYSEKKLMKNLGVEIPSNAIFSGNEWLEKENRFVKCKFGRLKESGGIIL